MKLRAGFLFLFFFMFSIVFVSADYDISSKYQKTEFNTTKWIALSHGIDINVSIGKFCLCGLMNDFNDYIEYNDSDNLITINSMNLTFIDIKRNYGAYVYKDMNLINNFSYLFDYEITNIISSDAGGSGSLCGVFCLTENLGTETEILSNSSIILNIQRRLGDNSHYRLGLVSKSSGVLDDYDYSIDLDVDVRYWCNYSRLDSVGKLYIFSDADRSILVDTLNCTVTNDDLRYIMAFQSQGRNTGLDNEITGYLYNFQDLNPLEGTLYTNNLLENISAKSIIIGFNGSANSDSNIKLYTSNDNSTWNLQIENDGLGILIQYKEILYDYSDLYVLFNITGLNESPEVDELFYLHTYECVAGSENKPYVFIILFTIIGMLLGSVIDRT